MPSCWKHISLEVHLILILYIVNKCGQELAVNGTPTLTTQLFDWDRETMGYFMALQGLFVLPVNVVVSKLVKNMDDRDLILYLSYTTLASVVMLMHLVGIRYSLFQYVVGSMVFFAALNSFGNARCLLSRACQG